MAYTGGAMADTISKIMNRHFRLATAALFVLLAGLSACGGGASSSGTTPPTDNTTPPTDNSTNTGGTPPGNSGTTFASFIGSNKLMIGAQMDDSTATAAPFDARYVYLAGGPAPAAACMSSCTASSACGNWWGCWQDPAQPPGQYASWHMQRAASATWQDNAHPQVPVFTYYLLLSASGGSEGANEVTAMNNASTLGRYLDDWRFLLQRIGNTRAMLHVEPDLWGFLRSVNSDPHAVPAQVTAANPSDCASHENSAAGFARCMIAMVRKYAPNAAVGLHASPWNYQAPGDATATANFMLALGAADGDFIVTDPSDRDAGYYSSLGQDRWWDDQKAAAYLAWSKTLAEIVGKPTVMWQIPLGNSLQNNTTSHWQDNRVDYLFAHLSDVADAHIAALLFGAGQQEQTTPETDGGNLIDKTISNWQAGGTSLR